MKNIMNFLKRHTAALLMLAMVLTMSVGTLWAKYETDVKVTDTLKLTVAQTASEEYVINKERLMNNYAAVKRAYSPTTVKFVTGSEVPSGVTLVNAFLCEDRTKYIAASWSATDKTLYYAPFNPTTYKYLDGVIYAPEDSSYLFDSSKTTFTNLTTIELSNLNTSRVTNMNGMFASNGKLTSVDLSNFDTSSVTNMMDMFGACTSLTELDMSNFDTQNVTNMQGLFYNCTKLDLLTLSSKFDTSKVTNMVWMFYGAGFSSLDLSSFDTSSVDNMNSMFAYCDNLNTLDLSSFNTSKVTNMSDMFIGCNRLTEVTLGANFDFDTNVYLPTPSDAYITGANGKWYDSSTKIGYTPADLATFHNAQDECCTYTAVKNYTIDNDMLQFALSDKDVAAAATLMFVTGSTVPNDAVKSGSVQADGSFEIGVYLSADKTTAYVAPADNTDSTSVMYAPEDSTSLLTRQAMTSIDCSNLDTSKVTNMEEMFANCRNATSLNVSSFNTSNVKSMTGMFGNCFSLSELNLSTFVTSSVTEMDCMFQGLEKVSSLNLSSFNTSNVKSMRNMFGECYALSELNLSTFVTSSVETMEDMFSGCKSLNSINLSNFDTSSVTTMKNMFANCTSLTSLDLSSFNTSIVTAMTKMFYSDTNLATIKVGSGFTTGSVQSSTKMFSGCTNLKGDAGTVYSDSNPMDLTYAHIDGGTSNPGYFTNANAGANGLLQANEMPLDAQELLDNTGDSSLTVPAEASPAVTETPAEESAPTEENADSKQTGSDDSNSTETPAGETAAGETPASPEAEPGVN